MKIQEIDCTTKKASGHPIRALVFFTIRTFFLALLMGVLSWIADIALRGILLSRIFNNVTVTATYSGIFLVLVIVAAIVTGRKYSLSTILCSRFEHRYEHAKPKFFRLYTFLTCCIGFSMLLLFASYLLEEPPYSEFLLFLSSVVIFYLACTLDCFFTFKLEACPICKKAYMMVGAGTKDLETYHRAEFSETKGYWSEDSVRVGTTVNVDGNTYYDSHTVTTQHYIPGQQKFDGIYEYTKKETTYRCRCCGHERIFSFTDRKRVL